LLFRHSKYSDILPKNTRTDCFFGDFTHWDKFCKFIKGPSS